MIYITTLLLSIASIVFLCFAMVRLLKKMGDSVSSRGLAERLAEFVFVYVFPGIGLYMTQTKCDDHPFDLEGMLTPYSIWILFALAYFISRHDKERVSPLVLLVVTSVMIGGICFCTAICIHFSPHLYAILFPGFQLIYISPLFCLLYLLKEIYHLNIYLSEAFRKRAEEETETSLFYRWLQRHHFGFSLYLLGPLVVVVQAFLYLLGQKPDSIISEFTASCGYLLSYEQSCSCGGDHYLCSIAANGNQKLVKPVRMGWRQNEKIVVNRQLLIANAFENWLEDHTPCFHKIIRKAYDDCKIPVNAWSKHSRAANVLYICMKPLELFFLAWLYAFDKNPENRIARQYLPKQDLQHFIKTKKS